MSAIDILRSDSSSIAFALVFSFPGENFSQILTLTTSKSHQGD